LKYYNAIHLFKIKDSKITCTVGENDKVDWKAEGDIIKITESVILIQWTKAFHNDGEQFLAKPFEIKIAFPEITKNLSIPEGPFAESYRSRYDQMASFERDPAEVDFGSSEKCIYYRLSLEA
jgi:hypothetical protein